MHRLRYLIGLVTLAAAIFAAVWMVRLLNRLDDQTGLTLSIEFRDARGLRAGADVRYRGVTVGTVCNVTVSGDGSKAVAQLLLDTHGATHACVNTSFWVVTPRFGGITGGATGLDTLVRDSYIAFHTPSERGSELVAGSLLAGREMPPNEADPTALDDIEHGDLLMTLLVPENHGLTPGSAVIFRGVQTGDVRSVELAKSGTHVEVQLRISREHRQTVTDQAQFWVARPHVSGALFSGFTVTDVSALLTPYISYYGIPGEGVLVQDGYRTAAQDERPEFESTPVPSQAMQRAESDTPVVTDDVVLVRITYAAIERDSLSPDDEILRHGSGVLFLDRSGRTIVVTARSLVDAAYTESDFWGDPEIDDEQIKVLLADGTVLRAGRVWVHPENQDLAALVLEDVRPDLVGTPSERLQFVSSSSDAAYQVRATGPDGQQLAEKPISQATGEDLGSGILVSGNVVGVLGSKPEAKSVTLFGQLPEDLRPR